MNKRLSPRNRSNRLSLKSNSSKPRASRTSNENRSSSKPRVSRISKGNRSRPLSLHSTSNRDSEANSARAALSDDGQEGGGQHGIRENQDSYQSCRRVGIQQTQPESEGEVSRSRSGPELTISNTGTARHHRPQRQLQPAFRFGMDLKFLGCGCYA